MWIMITYSKEEDWLKVFENRVWECLDLRKMKWQEAGVICIMRNLHNLLGLSVGCKETGSEGVDWI